MSNSESRSLEADVAVARTVVKRLTCLGTGVESDEWMAKFHAVERALAEGKYKRAIREGSRLTRGEPTWIVSRELAATLTKALGNIARHLKLPNPGKCGPSWNMLQQRTLNSQRV